MATDAMCAPPGGRAKKSCAALRAREYQPEKINLTRKYLDCSQQYCAIQCWRLLEQIRTCNRKTLDMTRNFTSEPCHLTLRQLKALSDEELMAHLQGGHADALAVLFDRYHRLVLTIASTILRDAAEAEDVMQIIFLDTRADGTIVNSTRPWGPNFEQANLFSSLGNSIYHSLQASLRHTTKRMTFFASYTYSKSMDNTSSSSKGPKPYNPNLSRSLSGFDMTHNFVASYAYLLPFDRLAGGHVPRLTSGWRVVGITRFATGFPVTLTKTDDRSLIGDWYVGVNTPDFLGGNLKFTDPRTGEPYFNPSLFTPDQLGYCGTANRRFFHGPGFNNWDLSLQKDTRLTESKTLELRAEFFNTFNHAQFLNPSGNINGNFGVVTGARDQRIGQVAVKFVF